GGDDGYTDDEQADSSSSSGSTVIFTEIKPGTVGVINIPRDRLVLEKAPIVFTPVMTTQIVKITTTAQSTLNKAALAMKKKDLSALKSCFTADAWEHYGRIYSSNKTIMPLIGSVLGTVKPAGSVTGKSPGDVVCYTGSATIGVFTKTVKVYLTLGDNGKWLITNL
ncbi:MAG: hypothetical protein DRQ24_12715, partial [Candidatus Latescibacterota bacterium]